MKLKGAFLIPVLLLGCSSPALRKTAASQEEGFTYTASYNCAGSENPQQWSALAGFKVGPLQKLLFKSPDEKILRPFTSDGCSLSPDGVSQEESWTECCVIHDLHYWVGGTLEEKTRADNNLEKCIAEKGHLKTGHLYNLSVSQFGGPETTQNFRWGYGWNYRRPYSALTEEEKKQIESLYGVDLERTQKNLGAQFKNLTISCNTKDFALNGFTKEEHIIYSYLNKKLKIDDTILWARISFHEEFQEYLLKLENCPTPITFMFSVKSNTLMGVQSSCSEL